MALALRYLGMWKADLKFRQEEAVRNNLPFPRPPGDYEALKALIARLSGG